MSTADFENQLAARFGDARESPEAFYPLLRDGLFDFGVGGEDRGSWKMYWPALGYIEKIAKQRRLPQYHGLASDIIQVIRRANRSPVTTGRTRAIESFAEIIGSLPPHVIGYADIDMIGEWLGEFRILDTIDGKVALSIIPNLLGGSWGQWRKVLKLVSISTQLHHHPRRPEKLETLLSPRYLHVLFKEDNSFCYKGGYYEIETTEGTCPS